MDDREALTQRVTASCVCEQCHAPVLADDRFCSGCGAAVAACVSCGAAMTAGASACHACGARKDTATAIDVADTSDAGWADLIVRVQEATVGELHFIRQLGRGGMAAVYLAEEIGLDRKVAIKLILPELMSDERMVKRFREEARTVAKLRHANIVRVHAVREAAGIHFFSMEYIEGRPLDAIIRAVGPMPVGIVLSVLHQVGSALGYAHRQGVFHRDIKPANILVDTDGNAFVTDFGIAKVRNATSKSETLTQMGAVVGTPAYISPEQCLSSAVTGASDQYSLGIVAYEMLTGAPPFLAESSFELMCAHTYEVPIPLQHRRQDCPSELAEAIERMLAKKPEERFSSIPDALSAMSAQVLADNSPLRLDLVAWAQPLPDPPPFRTPLPARELATELSPTRPTPAVAMIAIVPPPDRIEVGDELVLVAGVLDATGNTMHGVPVRWESLNEAIVSLNPTTGQLAARAQGAVEIVALAGRARGSVMVEVAPRAVAAIRIAPPRTRLVPGDEIVMSAIAEDRNGLSIDDAELQWTSSAPDIARIRSDGTLICVAEGETTLRCEAGGRAASCAVVIAPSPASRIRILLDEAAIAAGDVVSLTAEVRDRRGVLLPSRVVEFTVDDDSVALVSGASTFRALRAGRCTLFATCESARDSRLVVIRPAALASIEITGIPKRVAVGESYVLGARGSDRRGEDVTVGTPKWKTDDENVATVDEVGRLTTLAAGEVTITCSADEVHARTRLEVTARAAAAFRLTDVPIHPTAGTSFRIVPVLVDDRNAVITGRDVEWHSDDDRVGSVSPAGVVTLHQPGTLTVVATCEGLSASTSISVAPWPVSRVVIDQVPETVVEGTSLLLRCRALTSGGSEVPCTPHWSSKAPEIGSVRENGEFIARRSGRVRIIASVEGIDAEADVQVLAAIETPIRERVEPGPSPDTARSPLAPHDAHESGSAAPQLSALDPLKVRPSLLPVPADSFESKPHAKSTARLRVPEQRDNTPLAAALVLGAVAIGGGIYYARRAPSVDKAPSLAIRQAVADSAPRVGGSLTRIRPAAKDEAKKTRSSSSGYTIVVQAPRFVYVGKSVLFTTQDANTGATIRLRGWKSSDPRIARVDAQTGRVTGVSEGQARISVRVGDRSTGADIDVILPSMPGLPALKSTVSSP